MIVDEFLYLQVTRQKKYQLRHKKLGLCIKCNSTAVNSQFCDKHRLKQNVLMKKAGKLYSLRKYGFNV